VCTHRIRTALFGWFFCNHQRSADSDWLHCGRAPTDYGSALKFEQEPVNFTSVLHFNIGSQSGHVFEQALKITPCCIFNNAREGLG